MKLALILSAKESETPPRKLYFLQQSIKVTQAEQQLLREIRSVANARYATGRASQQDVLRADLEIASIENELIRLRQQLQSGRARLARLLHVSPHAALAAVEELPREDLPGDLDCLQRQAVAARPELHAQLAALQRDRQAVLPLLFRRRMLRPGGDVRPRHLPKQMKRGEPRARPFRLCFGQRDREHGAIAAPEPCVRWPSTKTRRRILSGDRAGPEPSALLGSRA